MGISLESICPSENISEVHYDHHWPVSLTWIHPVCEVYSQSMFWTTIIARNAGLYWPKSDNANLNEMSFKTLHYIQSKLFSLTANVCWFSVVNNRNFMIKCWFSVVINRNIMIKRNSYVSEANTNMEVTMVDYKVWLLLLFIIKHVQLTPNLLNRHLHLAIQLRHRRWR